MTRVQWCRSSVVLALLAGIAIGQVSGTTLRGFAAVPHSSPYSLFVGRWFVHGGVMTVAPSGRAAFRYRTYVNCTSTRRTACDNFVSSTIYPGGFTDFSLGRVTGRRARGTVSNSAYSWQVGTAVTLLFHPKKDTVALKLAGTGTTTLCGPHAPPTTCGA
jgi:hypothetical protein